MVWNSKSKALHISNVVGHVPQGSNITGRAPGISSLTFSPLALFGAAARCSHLHLVNPAITTPESLMIMALLEQYVDDVSNDFAILSSADTFKDFVKSYFAGTVAAGLSYLAMVKDGYVWADHFENLGGGASTTRQTPDFVFAGFGSGVALMESKGSRSAALGAFDTTVRDGYKHQVEPHLGHIVGSLTATHGYCIGAYLKSTTKAELRIHHTAVVQPSGGGDPDAGQSIPAVQRGNFASAFALAHSEELGREIRTGESPEMIPFLQFKWRGRTWLTSYSLGGYAYGPGYFMDHFRLFRRHQSHWWIRNEKGPSLAFAVEENIALTALRYFLSRESRPVGRLDIPTLPVDWDSEFGGEGEQDGATFPDGLMVLGSNWPKHEIQPKPVVWENRTGRLLPG